jgi:hypothetical protein
LSRLLRDLDYVLQVLHDTQPESALVKTINDCFTDIILMMKPPGEREEQAGHGMEVDKTESTYDAIPSSDQLIEYYVDENLASTNF